MRQTLCSCCWLFFGLLLVTRVTSLPGQQVEAPGAALALKELAKELAAPTDRLILHDGTTLTVKPFSQPLSDADVVHDPDKDPIPRKTIARVEFFEDRWLDQFDKALGKDPDIEQARAAEKIVLELWRQHRQWRVSPPLGNNPWKQWEGRIEDRLESIRVSILHRLLGEGQKNKPAALREAYDLGARWLPYGAEDGPLREAIGWACSAWAKHLMEEGQPVAAAEVRHHMQQELLAIPPNLVAELEKFARLLVDDGQLREAGFLAPNLAELDEAWDKRGHTRGQLRIAVRSLPEYISPITANSDSERLVLPLLFETLEQTGQTSAKTGVVALPKETLWSDGRALTANDVQHTLDLMSRPELPGRTAFFREFLDVRPEFNHARRLQATVRQGAWHEETWFRFWVLPQYYQGKVLTRADDSAFAKAPVGSGPYRFVGRKGGQADLAAVFRPNLYHKSRPTIQEIRLQVLGTPPPAGSPGTPHLAVNLSPTEAKAWIKAGYRLQNVPPADTFFLAVNHRVAALKNSNLRRALALSIDRGQILASYFGDKMPEQARPLNGPFRADSWAVSPAPRVPANLLNPEVAKSHAKQAVGELGAVELTLHFSREDPLAAHACKSIADQVEQMLSGVRLKPLGVPPAELRDLVHQRKYDLAYQALDYPEEIATLWSLFDTQPDALRPGGSNFLGYENDASLQILLRDLISHRQFAVVKSKFHDLHAHLNERMPLIPLWQAPMLVAVHPALQLPSLDGGPLLQNLAQWKLAKE